MSDPRTRVHVKAPKTVLQGDADRVNGIQQKVVKMCSSCVEQKSTWNRIPALVPFAVLLMIVPYNLWPHQEQHLKIKQFLRVITENDQSVTEGSIDFALYMQKHPAPINSLPQRNWLVLLEYYRMNYYPITWTLIKQCQFTLHLLTLEILLYTVFVVSVCF